MPRFRSILSLTAIALTGGVPAALIAGASLSAATPALAHKEATGVVKERMDAMEDMSRAMKPVGKMFGGEQAYEADAVARLAGLAQQHGGKAMTDLFPEGSAGHPSEALPDIWVDWTRFALLADELVDHGKALEAAAGTAVTKENRTAFLLLASTCKDCHEDFKED